MTDNEILANEILCIRRRSSGSCNGGTDCNTCDLLMNESEIIAVYERAMKQNDLIHRQKAELSKKDTEIDILIRKKESLNDEISELQHKIASCNAEIKRLEFDNVHWNDWEVKCRAINEFAERLKEDIPFITSHLGNVSVLSLYRNIDNLVQEMTERKEDEGK